MSETTAELQHLIADTNKLLAEQQKLLAEAAKLKTDRLIGPAIIIFGGFGSFVAAATVVYRLLHGVLTNG
jgi:hypothetical protein